MTVNFYAIFCNCTTNEMPLGCTILKSALCKEERRADKNATFTIHWNILEVSLSLCFTFFYHWCKPSCRLLSAYISLHHRYFLCLLSVSLLLFSAQYRHLCTFQIDAPISCLLFFLTGLSHFTLLSDSISCSSCHVFLLCHIHFVWLQEHQISSSPGTSKSDGVLNGI